MFNTTSTIAQVKTAIGTLGGPLTINKASGVSIKTVGVQTLETDKDLVLGSNLISSDVDVIYVPGGLKASPEVGDVVVFFKNLSTIQSVTPYKPANTIIAYKLTVT